MKLHTNAVLIFTLFTFLSFSLLLSSMHQKQAQAALMYDAVFVLVEALNNVLRKKPDQFRTYTARRGIQQAPSANSSLGGGGHARALDCNTSKGWVSHWEHGDKISRFLRKVYGYYIEVILLYCVVLYGKSKIEIHHFQLFPI